MAMGEEQTGVKLNLKSKDGQTFSVAKEVAVQMKFIEDMIEDVDIEDGKEIPMGEIEGCILEKIVTYCEFHHAHPLNRETIEEIDKWETRFVVVEKSVLFRLILVSCSFSFHHGYSPSTGVALSNMAAHLFPSYARRQTFLTSSLSWTYAAKRAYAISPLEGYSFVLYPTLANKQCDSSICRVADMIKGKTPDEIRNEFAMDEKYVYLCQ